LWFDSLFSFASQESQCTFTLFAVDRLRAEQIVCGTAIIQSAGLSLLLAIHHQSTQQARRPVLSSTMMDGS